MRDNYFYMLPHIDHEEMMWLNELTKNFDDEKLRRFMMLYQNSRKDPQMILICTLIGFVAVAGIQRFVLNQILMGFLYLITGGLCLIGTIYDIINYKKLAWEYNKTAAMEAAAMVGYKY
ncbi:hypothetical protein LX64_03819 [Chitinophaga skermanii]|uniref:TM2 domain-containing protein n=1 Tax=Chitinophaga skermanii TaxID=331697 RepID=A0A327QD97_9BACT|nr:NINE protein [Chitinophaga skermanii]RAJ01602.1 hypothetical protein LX64_03819 [Chitinophaga skermanii]